MGDGGYFFNFEKMSYVRGKHPAGCILCLARDRAPEVVDLSIWRDDAVHCLRQPLSVQPGPPARLSVPARGGRARAHRGRRGAADLPPALAPGHPRSGLLSARIQHRLQHGRRGRRVHRPPPPPHHPALPAGNGNRGPHRRTARAGGRPPGNSAAPGRARRLRSPSRFPGADRAASGTRRSPPTAHSGSGRVSGFSHGRGGSSSGESGCSRRC